MVIALVYHPLTVKTYYDEESIMSESDIKPKQINPAANASPQQQDNQRGNQPAVNENKDVNVADVNVNELADNKAGNSNVDVRRNLASNVRQNEVSSEEPAEAAVDTTNTPASTHISGVSSSRPPQILIAEDEYLIAASIRDALMRYGETLNVVVVQRSNMLVDNINNLKPDVLLMDITLKGAMDGIEAIQHIKATGRDIPVIYITADSRITTLERAETTNPVAYLIKPFREADLHKALAKALALLED